MKVYTSDKRTPRPYFTTVQNQRILLGFAARRTIGKYHTSGTWHYIPHTVGGVTRMSHYLTGETWHGEAATTYRVRRWHGPLGAGPTEIVQDQYPYYVPSSINNAQGAASRTAFAQAVANWQDVVTEEEKIVYNQKATKGIHMSGYNLYIRDYMKANT